MTARRLAGLVLVFAAGCGSGSKSPAVPSATELAASLNDHGFTCTGFTLDTSGELFTREQGTCTAGSEAVTVYTFATDDAQANWTKAAAQFGGVRVTGERWVVAPEKQATAERVQEALGGTVR